MRLCVEATRNVASGVVVRYRQCTACGYRLTTEERVSKTRKAKQVKSRPISGTAAIDTPD